MSRGVLIIIVVVLVLAIAGLGLAIFWHPGILNVNHSNANTNTNTAKNTNSAVTNQNVNTAGQGFKATSLENKTINKAPKFHDTTVPIDHVEVTNGYSGVRKAEDGKKIVMVYLDGTKLKNGVSLTEWIGQEVQLIDSDGNVYHYDRAVLKQSSNTNTDNYISFSVNDKATGFKLRFVRSGEDVTVDLGI